MTSAALRFAHGGGIVLLCLVLLIPSSGLLAQDNTSNFYAQGQHAAELDYSGSGAMVGGLVSGFLLGLIGWGVGYLIVNNTDVEVPAQHVSNLEHTQRVDFEAGYRAYVKSTRKQKFNLGGGIGVVGAVVFNLSNASD